MSAYAAMLAQTLGLRPKDLAELGGFSERYARDVIKGRANIHQDVVEALNDLDDDCDSIYQYLMDQSVIVNYLTNEALRESVGGLPARGKAGGGFVGPYRIAAMEACQWRLENGLECRIVFESEL